jgi:hypothetical protein
VEIDIDTRTETSIESSRYSIIDSSKYVVAAKLSIPCGLLLVVGIVSTKGA